MTLSLSALLKYTCGFCLPTGLCLIRSCFGMPAQPLPLRLHSVSLLTGPDTEPVARTQQKTQNTCLRCKSQSLQSGRDELNRQPGKYKTAAVAVLRQVHGAECGLLRGVRAGFPEEGTNERGSTSTQAINLGEREELSRHGEEQRPLGRRTRGTEPRLERRRPGTLPRITVKPGWGGDFSPDLRIAGLFS